MLIFIYLVLAQVIQEHNGRRIQQEVLNKHRQESHDCIHSLTEHGLSKDNTRRLQRAEHVEVHQEEDQRRVAPIDNDPVFPTTVEHDHAWDEESGVDEEACGGESDDPRRRGVREVKARGDWSHSCGGKNKQN